MSLFKEGDNNGLNRQIGKPRIVYDVRSIWGGGGNSERCLNWVVGVIKGSLLRQL